MTETIPNCLPAGIYCAKRTCAELGVCYKTLRKYVRRGYIQPVNPNNHFRPRYSGKAIIECWKTLHER